MRHSTIPKYLLELIECPDSDFFLTASTNQVENEIYRNCIYVFLAPDEIRKISANDLQQYIQAVKNDRRRKLDRHNEDIDLIFYIWFDEQAGQLRFNFINSNHQRLPFSCKLLIVDNEKEIIDEFLSSEGIIDSQFEGISEIIDDSDQNDETFVLKVYTEIIKRT